MKEEKEERISLFKHIFFNPILRLNGIAAARIPWKETVNSSTDLPEVSKLTVGK